MHSPKILIIDDETFYLDVLVDILTKDYQLLIAKSGEEGLQRLQANQPPDLILLDVVMPGIDGYETLAKIRSNPVTADIPVIFLTARSDAEAEAHGLGLGAVDYITKPISAATVRARIHTHLALRFAQQELQGQNQLLEQRVKKRTESLRQLSAELVLVEERERRRIASELHDGPTQRLVLSKIKIGNLRNSIESEDPAFDDILENLNKTLQEIRTLIIQLSPPTLYELGLGPAVEWLAESIFAEHSIDYRVDSAENYLDLSEESRVFLFQAIRELLINIIKHAEASRVSVSINTHDNDLIIEILDDGKGIGEIEFFNESPEKGGFGLFTLRERIYILGGELNFESKNGTLVTLQVPISKG